MSLDNVIKRDQQILDSMPHNVYRVVDGVQLIVDVANSKSEAQAYADQYQGLGEFIVKPAPWTLIQV